MEIPLLTSTPIKGHGPADLNSSDITDVDVLGLSLANMETETDIHPLSSLSRGANNQASNVFIFMKSYLWTSISYVHF